MNNFVQQQQSPYQQYRVSYRLTPIASDAELNGMPVEYNGNPTYFHNQSTDETYVRYFDIKTGITPTIRYSRTDKQPAQAVKQETPKYEEQFKLMAEQLAFITEELKKLKSTKGVLKDE